MTVEPQMADDGIAEVAFRYSVDELAAVAALAGAATFPGTGDYRLEQPAEQWAARRALVARGTVAVARDGTATIEPVQRALLACALRPGAVLSIEQAVGGVVSTHLVYVTRELSVSHAQEGGGVHRLAAFPTSVVPRRVAALAGLRAGDAGAGEPIPVAPEMVERLAADPADAAPQLGLDGDLRATCALHVVRHAGERITAGRILLVDAGARGLLLADDSDHATVLRPVAGDEVVERLRLLLD